jgi:hypothetical protein
MTSGSVEAEPLEIKRVPVLMALIKSKLEALKKLENTEEAQWIQWRSQCSKGRL